MKYPQWLRHGAALMFAALAMSIAPSAYAQSVLSDPDFSGMNKPSSYFQLVARDATRGRNYVLGSSTTHINGIQVGAFSRVDDLGRLDFAWNNSLEVPNVLKTLLLGNGELIFLEGRYGASWQRLRQTASGGAVPEPFRWTNESLAQNYMLITASDSQGNTYAVFERPTSNGAFLATLRRVNADGVPDAGWRLDIDAVASSIRQLAISADGSVFYAAISSDGQTLTSTLGRTSASDTLRWTASLEREILGLATDAVGRAYVASNKLAMQGLAGTLLRVGRTGSIDAGWMPLANSPSPTTSALIRVLDDRVVVMTWNGIDRPLVRLLALAEGRVLASRAVPSGALFAMIDAGGTVVLNAGTKLVLWSPTATDFVTRDVAVKAGTAPVIASIKRWGAGYVVGGEFEYAYGGIRYANLMRLGADLKPDPSWRHGVTGAVSAITVDRDGGLMVGGERLLEGRFGLIRFAADGRLDPRWRKSFNAAVFAVTAASDGVVFAGGRFGKVDDVNRPAIARFNADGMLQADWVQTVPWKQEPGEVFFGFLNSDGVRKIIDAGDAGVLVTWEQQLSIPFGFDGISHTRFSRRNDGVIVPNSAALDAINLGSVVQDPKGGALFAMRSSSGLPFIVRLLPGTLEIDPEWFAPVSGTYLAAVSDTHLYLGSGQRMLRSLGGATLDPNWRLDPSSSGLSGRFIAGWIDTDTPGDGLTWASEGAAPLVVRTPSSAIGERAAVEYFAKDVNRFFITARFNEVRALDANPTQFARTGMQFGAFDGTVVPPKVGVIEIAPPQPLFRPDGALPICRFYSPPLRGGSNTHFYGRRTDCQLLNTYAEVVNEGYDFAAPPPGASSGACPANAPVPVYRLFNNLAASDNGNHRYVVSLARIDEMKSRGWLDEGVAFCATYVVDSRAFGQW